MKERKTVYRWLWVWDFEKEERWLNQMAQEGWALAEVGFCRYVFEACEPGQYTIRLEMHQQDDAYLNFLREMGAEYIGRVVMWIYVRRDAALGPFDLFSDLDSKIAHVGRISSVLTALGVLNLGIGVHNSLNGLHFGWINLLCATLLMYGLGRLHGMKERLELERQLHE